ncbi:MAG TPA: hypothetical protein VGB42_03440, partial [Candidatus Thermoplasmatota archaeon]
KTVAAQDVLERLIDIGVSKPDLVRRSYSPVRYPISKARRKATRALAEDWGGETSEDDIARVLYGGNDGGSVD